MKTGELIETINSLNNAIFKFAKLIICAIIKNRLNDSRKIITVKSEKEICGSNGFYMIFSDNKEFPKNKCIVKHNKTKYHCVYRGHSYNMRKRLISHLFYTPGARYDNCMKITVENGEYNINLDQRELYLNGKKGRKTFPKGNWIVVTIPLGKSKQGLREMFERAFDEEYGKPAFSKK